MLDDVDLETTEKLLAASRDDKSSGIGFSEIMSGFIHIGDDVEDFEIATKMARSECETARFFLSVKSWNTEDCKSSRYRYRFKADFDSGL